MIYEREGNTYTEQEVRRLIPNVSLPAILLPEHVAPYGFAPYTVPQPTLDDLRTAARMRINQWQAQERLNGFDAIGHRWDSRPESRENLTNVALSGQNPLGFWTSADDEDVPVTLADLQAIYEAMLLRGAQIHARQRQMKAAISTMSAEQLQTFIPGWD